MTNKTVVIVGAGPAGLTAAFELLKTPGIRPIVFDGDTQVGGISKTVNYRGNRMDLGGHRFFSKSDWVMNWWQNILPVYQSESDPQKLQISYQHQSRELNRTTREADPDKVMLVRPRLSRIFYKRKFFDYPVKLNINTLSNLGLLRAVGIGASYMYASAFPRKPERSLEDFFINRFGDQLYRTFFKDYTEKVWGVSCNEIDAEWGAQRIKGLSISKALWHAAASLFRGNDLSQKDVETSLIERFLYPKFGPGQMWEEVADRVQQQGGQIHLEHKLVGIHRNGLTVHAIDVRDLRTGETRTVACDTLISTMPLAELIGLLQPDDSFLLSAARALPYRDFMTAGLVVRQMESATARGTSAFNRLPPDNWIYIQESDVRIGRLQIFNNWSPALVADPNTVSLGLEYFCNADDGLWSMQDSNFLAFAAAELEKIGLIRARNVLDGTVVRVPKAYPAYFGEYRQIHRLRRFLDPFQNLFAIGRNGMHRYNNQDHSMLAARAAVQSITEQSHDKSAIWAVNSEDDYHEQRG